jgi:hypothetical protein
MTGEKIANAGVDVVFVVDLKRERVRCSGESGQYLSLSLLHG